MMTSQPIDFIVGCLFNRIETTVFKEMKNQDTDDITIGDCEMIPKVWFGLRCNKDYTNDITGDNKHYLKSKLERVLADAMPRFDISITKIVPDAQYIRFDYNVTKKTTAKKMTVEQIEKELGYKVEIVSEVE